MTLLNRTHTPFFSLKQTPQVQKMNEKSQILMMMTAPEKRWRDDDDPENVYFFSNMRVLLLEHARTTSLNNSTSP